MLQHLAKKPEPTAAVERQPPYDVVIEQMLLGAILDDNERYWHLCEVLRPKHFYDGLHRHMYMLMAQTIEQGEKVTPATLAAAMRGDPKLEDIEVGGLVYFEACRDACVAVPPIDRYVEILIDLHIRLKTKQLGEFLIENAEAPATTGTPIRIVLQTASEAIFELTHDDEHTGPQRVSLTMEESIQAAEDAVNTPERVRILTEFSAVNEHLGGFFPGQLTTLAAPPSVGKTGLGTQIALHAARSGHTTLIASLEMEGAQLTTRYLAQDIGIPASQIEEARITHADVEHMALAARAYGVELPLFIHAQPAMTVGDIRASAQAVRHRASGIDFLLVDHLRLVRADEPRDPEHERLEQITRDLKALANDFHIPVLLIATLNREFWKRQSKRPLISDIYGSSGVEYNSDSIWFLHSEAHFLEREEPPYSDEKAHAEWSNKLATVRGVVELFSAKRRNGPLGTVKLRFDAPFIRFAE